MKTASIHNFERVIPADMNSLAYRLFMRRIPVIPTALVTAHKRRTALCLQARMLNQLSRLLRFDYPASWLERQTGTEAGYYLLFAFRIALAGIGLNKLGYTDNPAYFLFLAPVAGDLLFATVWLRYVFNTWTRYLMWRQKPATPDNTVERLWSRVLRAQELGATVRIEFARNDPFLVAIRGRERVYIGAWDTKDPALDTF